MAFSYNIELDYQPIKNFVHPLKTFLTGLNVKTLL